MSSEIKSVSRISFNDFNSLPTVQEAWANINEQKNNDGKDFHHVLNETVGSVMFTINNTNKA